MTIRELIAYFDGLRPNALTAAQKLQAISDLDSDLHGRLLVPRGLAEEGSFTPYPASVLDSGSTAEPLVPQPLQVSLYCGLLAVLTDTVNHDTDRLAHSRYLYERTLQAYADGVNRKTPLPAGSWRW